MSSSPVFNYKTSTVGGGQPAPKSGKATTPPGASGSSGTSSSPPTDSYLGKLEAEGNKKMGKTPPPDESESGDPVTDFLNTLDKMNNEGVPQGNMQPFVKITAESALSNYPDAPQDVLAKFNSVVDILEKKISDLSKGLASGTGTSQQVQAAQQLKSQLEDLLSFYKIQRDKVAEIIPQKEKFWVDEVKNFQATGGSGDPRDFDLDDDGWIGKPEAKDSYRIGMRTFDKAYEDPMAKKLFDAGAKVQYQFKMGETQYWAINPKTEKRIQFDPKTKQVIGEQVAKPGYVTDMGVGFGGGDDLKILPDKGVIELKTGNPVSSQLFAEAGLELHTAEYLWAEVDSDGELVKDELGNLKMGPFELKDGRLIQKTPTGDDQTHYKQIYVKEMRVRTESKDGSTGGDIIVDLRGGDDNAKLMSLHITSPDSKAKASDVALAITSGDPKGPSHRETPIILDAGAYESTSRKGIKDPKHFYDKLDYDNSNPQSAQIKDTLKHFVAKSGSEEIDSLLNRGIAFQTRGYIKGTNGNDMLLVDPAPDYLTAKDGTSNTVFVGQGGHNAIFGQEVGSVFATGITMASIENAKGDGDISIGINPYGEKKNSKTGTVEPATSMKDKSNKLYIHVKATEGKVAVQSTYDGTLDVDKNKGTGDPAKDVWDTGDDYYDVWANEVGTNSVDGNNPNQSFDPDLQTQNFGKPNERKPIHGTMVAVNTNDFSTNGESYKDHLKVLEDNIKKKATDVKEDWKIEGTTRAWMKDKHYQGDKNTLDQFFSDFSTSKVNTLDPFKQVDKGMKQAGGDE